MTSPINHSSIAIHTNYIKPPTPSFNNKIKIIRIVLTLFLKIALLSLAVALLATFAFSYISPIIFGKTLLTGEIIQFGTSIFLSSSVIATMIATVRKARKYFRIKKAMSPVVSVSLPIIFTADTGSPLIKNNLTLLNPPMIPLSPITDPHDISINIHSPKKESPIKNVTPNSSPLSSPKSDFHMVNDGDTSPMPSPNVYEP